MATGLIAAVFLGRLIASSLFEMRPVDPTTFWPLVLGLFAALACYLPAKRGACTDPLSLCVVISALITETKLQPLPGSSRYPMVTCTF
jgi:hypothetical protein